jgi:fatty-acyl-CoA synthase
MFGLMQDRTLPIVHRKPEAGVIRQELIDFLGTKVAKWWLPDDVQFVESILHTATGKILKTRLREDFKDYKLPTT